MCIVQPLASRIVGPITCMFPYVIRGVRDVPSLLLCNRAAMLSHLLVIGIEFSSTIDCSINHSSRLPVIKQNATIGRAISSGIDAAECISDERVYLLRRSLWTKTERSQLYRCHSTARWSGR